MFLRFTLTCFCLFLLASPGAAAPSLMEAWEEQTNSLLQGLTEQQRKQFEILTLSNGILHSIKHVETTLGNAVKSCSKANPDLKNDLYGYYGGLQKNLTNPMKSAKSRIDKMIKSQTITSPKKMGDYIKLTNQVAIEKDKKVEWVPISLKEDCKKLLGTLQDGKTTNRLVSHLNDTFGVGRELKN